MLYFKVIAVNTHSDKFLFFNNLTTQKHSKMVKIINYKKRQTEDGREFFVLEISAGVEIIQSQNTGNFYASLKRTFIPCSFDEPTCIALIGSEIGDSIEKVECEPYQYVNKETGEITVLYHRYSYVKDTPKSTENQAVTMLNPFVMSGQPAFA